MTSFLWGLDCLCHCFNQLWLSRPSTQQYYRPWHFGGIEVHSLMHLAKCQALSSEVETKPCITVVFLNLPLTAEGKTTATRGCITWFLCRLG